jgi:NAD(P)-dependent dehydrogenase (short-subunit alcohol dehydrogenase family)
MKRRSMNAPLQNKVAVVTSRTLGIGSAADLAHAKAGAKVVVAGHRESEGQAVVHGIENSGGRGLFVKPDVTLEAGWASRQQNT